MSNQYLRQWSLIVADNSGSGLDLSELKIKFAVKQADIQTPNTLYLRIYNLNESTKNAFAKGEFTSVILQAGYKDSNYGIVFVGNIKFTAQGHESPVDSYVDILCADGDAAYNFATLTSPSSTLAAGSTPADHVNASLQAMDGYGVTAGFIAQLGTSKLSRGKVMYGMVRDALRILTRTYGVTWSIVDGKLQMVNLNSYAPGEAIVLTAATGLVGYPRQEPDGIHLRCLLNPNIKVAKLIKLDNASIIGFLGSGQYGFNPAAIPTITATDGIYKSYVVEHSGDTRGQEWYTDIICLANSGSVFPQSLVPRTGFSPVGG